MKSIGTIFLILFSSTLFAQEIFVHADEMPYFPGCNDFGSNKTSKRKCSNSNLVHFISSTLKYPEEAKENSIEGTVLVSFIVDNKGLVKDPYVIKDIGGGCGEAALDVVKKMIRWEAGINDGEKVNVKLNLPIKFSISSDSDSGQHSIQWGVLKSKKISRKDLKANIEEAIIVRDAFGNTLTVTELIFAYEKKNRFVDAISQGHIDKKQRRLIKRARKGGVLTIAATIQESGEFITVDREFEIVKAN